MCFAYGGANARERYVQSSEVGRALSEQLYRQGRSTDWRAAVERATGEPLDPAPLLAEFDPLPAPLR